MARKRTPTSTPEELAAYVNGLFDRELQRQRKEHPSWYLALSYLAGKQWVWFNERARVVDVIPRAPGEKRLTINRIKPTLEQVLDQCVASNPRWHTAPTSNTEAGFISARAWQGWYDWIWQANTLERPIRDGVLTWGALTGYGILRVTWDGMGGRKKTVRIPVEPDQTLPEENANSILHTLIGTDQAEKTDLFKDEEIQEGDFSFKVCSPFNVFVDPSAEDISKIRWLLEASYVHRQEVEELYGVELAADIATSPVANYSRKVLEGIEQYCGFVSSSIVGRGADGKYVRSAGLYPGDDKENLVLLKELWVAPNKEHPHGRYIVVAGDQVLEDRDNPYGRIPYCFCTWSPRPGSIYADGLIPALCDIQRELNVAFSRQSVLLQIHSNPPWLVHKRSQIDPAAFTDRPGQIIVHDTPPGVGIPNRQTPPLVTTNYEHWIAQLEAQMQEVAGLRGASRGVNPEGVRSGTMLSMLIQANATGRRPVIARYREFLQDVAQLLMEITRRYVKEDRLISVIGNDGTVLVQEFTRQDIEHGFDVRVSVGDGLPDDPMARSEFVMGLAKSGLFDLSDNEQRAKLRKMIEFGTLSDVYDEDTQERYRIHLENLRMMAGQEVQVKEYDLHKMHAEAHVRFMRSFEAQQAFEENPELEQAFRVHKDLHLDWLSAGQAQVPFAPGSTPASGQLLPPAGGGADPSNMAGLLGMAAAPQSGGQSV